MDDALARSKQCWHAISRQIADFIRSKWPDSHLHLIDSNLYVFESNCCLPCINSSIDQLYVNSSVGQPV